MLYLDRNPININTNLDWKQMVTVLVIIVCTIVLNRLIRWTIHRLMVGDSRGLNVDHTKFAFFKNAISLFIWIIAGITIIYTIPAFRSLALTLFTGAGLLVAIAGFAAQKAFANIISGVFIVIFRPFRVGDQIKVGDNYYGTVEDITLRHTVIVNFENKRVIIPNASISEDTVINDTITEPKVCRHILVGISYDSDVDLAIRIIQEVAEAHPLFYDNRTQAEKKKGIPAVQVRLIDFGDFSVNLKAFVWTKDPVLVFEMHSDINRQIKKRFDREGIEIPFPYRTIVYKKDLPPTAKGDNKEE